MNGQGFGGDGMSGGGIGGGGGPPRRRTSGPGRDRLAVVRGGVGARQAAPSFDPEPDADWRAMVERWSRGKKARIAGGEVRTLPWVAMEVLDPYTEALIHPIDYLPIGQEDYEWVVHEVWERCKSEARRHDDGNPHDLMVKCWFADVDADDGVEDDEDDEEKDGDGENENEGGGARRAVVRTKKIEERSFDTRTFEKTMVTVTLPRNRSEWGRDGAYVASRYGRVMGSRQDPHHMDQEIQWMEMARGMVQDAFQNIRDENRDIRRELHERRQHDKDMIERERNVRKIEREERWEDVKQEKLLKGAEHLFGRLGKVAPVAIARLSEAISDKISKKPKRTTRDENAYQSLVELVRRAKAKVERMARQAGQTDFEFTMPMFMMLLKEQFDIEQDDPIVNKLISVMTEAEIERVRDEVEMEARMPGGGIVVEQRKTKAESVESEEDDGEEDEDEDDQEKD